MIEVVGYFCALLIGLTLGLIGGGGSILTVPVMVYTLSINPVLATAYSLFVVGVSSLVGAIEKFNKGLVSIKASIVFSIPAFVAVYLTRLILVPAIPQEIFTIGNYILTKDSGIMIFFAVIMVLAAVSMLRKRGNESPEQEELQFNYPLVAVEGIVVGVLTGIVGAGGGFLIIPALVLLSKLPMKLAIGTSLMIIAVKSLGGFVGDIQSGQPIDWVFLLTFTGFSIVGIFLGGMLSKKVSGDNLKVIFAFFVLALAVIILIKELIL